MTSSVLSQKKRCSWAEAHPLLAAYHDDTWGMPKQTDQAFFEALMLESLQTGLSWLTVLKKHGAYREAFFGFDPEKVQAMPDRALEDLMGNPHLIRHRGKMWGLRTNARVFLEIQHTYGRFSTYLQGFVPPAPQPMDPKISVTPESKALAKNLKQKGMVFLGPTTLYAFMQAVGIVNAHETTCWKYTPPL